MTASERQSRVYEGALKLFLHRNGPGATYGDVTVELQDCVAVAVELEATVESALSQTVPPKDGSPF